MKGNGAVKDGVDGDEDPLGVRAYAQRAWGKYNPPTLLTGVAALRANWAARARLLALNPDWPGGQARSDDLAAHIRFREILDRVEQR